MSETPHNNNDDETPWWDRALTPEEVEEQIRQRDEELGLGPFDLDEYENREKPWWDRALTPEEVEEEIRQREEAASTSSPEDNNSDNTRADGDQPEANPDDRHPDA